MTPEAQRIAIAEMCGYTHMPNAVGLMWNVKENRAVITPGSDVEKARLRMKMSYEPGKETLPDYTHDLNAMHEAEKTLFRDQWERYTIELEKTVGLDDSETEWGAIKFRLSHATAAQRAEAFLRTIGKWTDD